MRTLAPHDLVYAHDCEAGEKRAKAADLVGQLWCGEPSPVISAQVLQELYVNLVRKEVSRQDSKSCVRDYSSWDVRDCDAVKSESLCARIGCRLQGWSMTANDALKLQILRYREMTAEERVAPALDLHEVACEVAERLPVSWMVVNIQ